jgi:hypothetical protein
MTYKVEHIAETHLEDRLNELCKDGWTLFSIQPHQFATEDAAPIYVTVWTKS